MTSTRLLDEADERAFASLAAGLAGLLAGRRRALPQQLEVIRRVEAIRRQWAVLDHALINDLDPIELHATGAVDVTALLVREVHIAPGEAKARVNAAADLGRRFTSSGEVVAPVFAPIAAAQAAGAISVEHAAVIRRAVDSLSDAVEASDGLALQAELVEQATRLNPVELARAAAHAAAALDPEAGMSDAEIERRRDASLVQRRDGMFELRGVLTPECGAGRQTVFDSLAAPAPSVDGTRDSRSPGQRRHDALREVPLILLRAEALPDCGGVVATMLVTLTADQAESGAGYATTSHGDLIPVRRLLALAIDSQIMNVLFDPHGGVLDYGRTRRLAPQAMRLALYARDGGCTFPDCDRPPPWTQAHHCVEWDDGGVTSIANLALVCGYHHREFASKHGGWRCTMINNIPHWIPPTAVDPTRTPRRNTRHQYTRAAA
jgi:hypothetical protein